MTVTPLSQRDARWARKTLGFSKLTIGGYGCTITSLTMLINSVEGKSYRVDEINERLKALGEYHWQKNPKGAFTGALLVWKNVQLAFPSIKFVKRAYNYNNTDVAWTIYVRKMPVMVEVNASSIGASRHWVLYCANRQCADPWVGKIVPTSKYPATGYSIYHKA
jgi:hypothetical protein